MPALPISQLPARLSEDEDDLPTGDVEVELPAELPAKYREVENEDGSVDIFDEEDAGPQFSEDFGQNLAEVFEPRYLRQLGSELKELIERDVEDREGRDQQYADGIRRTGLGKDAPGGANFAGASKVVHPMLAKGCVDFASRAIKELYPATGPCKTEIIGENTEEKIDKADRKKTYMNWQSTTQIEENRAELERLLSQVPLAGAAYKRWWWDAELRRPRTEAVFVDDVFTPYGSADFYTSPRVAYRQLIDQQEYEKRIRIGLYRDTPESSEPGYDASTETSKSREASEKVEGVDSSSAMVYNDQGLRLVWLIEVTRHEEEDPEVDRPAPYIIHLDGATDTVLGIFRNWEPDDDRLRKKHWMSEWSFIPWRGGPAIGLAHLIGSLAAAATGSLRAILDAAHIQNFPGALRLSGVRGAGQSKSVEPTAITEIEVPAGVDDIRKAIMPFPFNGANPVLFQVMEWLTQQAEQVVATASEKIADAGANMPVGTALALIEHGSTNFSAIHSRLHTALARDLQILHRLNGEYMDDEETVEELGELVVRREDFLGPMDVKPVSDPNIFSEAQRYAQLQAVLQLKGDPQFAQFFKPEALLNRALKLLNVPDVDGIANLPKEAKRLSPLEENYAVASNERPLKVYPDQDDISHLKVHIHFATSPMFGANPLIASGVLAPLLQHCKEHILSLWKKHSMAATTQYQKMAKAQGVELSVDKAQVFGAALADQLLAGILGEMVMPGLEQMQQAVTQIVQSSAPKPSPDIALMEQNKLALGQAELAMRERVEMAKINAQGQKLQFDQRYEDAARDSQERLAQLATSVELIRDQQKAGASQALAEFQAESQRNLTVLQSVLKATLEEAGAGAAGLDQDALIDALMTPLMGSLQGSIEQAVTGLTSANEPLHNMVTGLAQQQEAFRQILVQQAATNSESFARIAQGLEGQAQAAPQGQLPTVPQEPQDGSDFPA